MPVVRRIVAAGSRFDIEVVRLTTALVDEVARKVEITLARRSSDRA